MALSPSPSPSPSQSQRTASAVGWFPASVPPSVLGTSAPFCPLPRPPFRPSFPFPLSFHWPSIIRSSHFLSASSSPLHLLLLHPFTLRGPLFPVLLFLLCFCLCLCLCLGCASAAFRSLVLDSVVVTEYGVRSICLWNSVFVFFIRCSKTFTDMEHSFELKTTGEIEFLFSFFVFPFFRGKKKDGTKWWVK